MSRLQGKVAVVTGASKGIGAAIARSLAAEGAAVVVNYASSREGAERVVAEITGKGGKAVALHADVSKAEDVSRLFAETKKTFGPVDVLVNNAGVYDFAPIEAVTESEFHRQFGINVLGPLLTTREAVKHFGSKGGSVINISSVVSENPLANSVVYSASKSAVDSISRALATELGPRGIRVNTIAPGAVSTEGSRRFGILESDVGKDIVARTPLGRFGEPDDIAPVAVFLASDESRWVTGERLSPAGGLR
jgi:3-oxoacyl-[acyl-carrier protein] reductase